MSGLGLKANDRAPGATGMVVPGALVLPWFCSGRAQAASGTQAITLISTSWPGKVNSVMPIAVQAGGTS